MASSYTTSIEKIFNVNNQSSTTTNNLCCCEYIDKDNKHFHILACCCNCYDLDAAFTRCVHCEPMESRTLRNMLLTFQDRFRIPWYGGAKQITLDIWLSPLSVALVLAIAAINVYTMIIMIIASVSFISYAYYYIKRAQIKSRIFAFWLLWSIIYMSVLMEFTVPLLEFLPEEHLILVILACASVYCLWVTHSRANLNHVKQCSVNENNLPNIDKTTIIEENEKKMGHTALLVESPDYREQNNCTICNSCPRYNAATSIHCPLCGTCILGHNHHSYWLNCCIGQWNYYHYLFGLFFSFITVLLCANLILTAVCHPFIVFYIMDIAVMLPDDCNEVFSEYTLGLSFIGAVYCLIIAIYLLVALGRQILHVETLCLIFKRTMRAKI